VYVIPWMVNLQELLDGEKEGQLPVRTKLADL
jgi:hypothetical protein